MFTLEGSHIVMSRTDAQNGLDFHFNARSVKMLIGINSSLAIGSYYIKNLMNGL
jgi:hypothetical protein